MGMFDSIFINIRCPYCKVISEMECQTKYFDCELSKWRKGDYIGTMITKNIPIRTWCKCGKNFSLNVTIANGIVTGQYEITEEGALDSYHDEKFCGVQSHANPSISVEDIVKNVRVTTRQAEALIKYLNTL